MCGPVYFSKVYIELDAKKQGRLELVLQAYENAQASQDGTAGEEDVCESRWQKNRARKGPDRGAHCQQTPLTRMEFCENKFQVKAQLFQSGIRFVP